MNYELIHETLDNNASSGREQTVAISESKSSLIKFAKEEFGVRPLRDNEDATEENYIDGDFWSGFLFIKPTDIRII